MMKSSTTNILFFSFLGYFGYKMLAKSGAAKALQFFVQKVSLRFSGITPVIDFVIGIQNPTNETLRIGSIVGELYINGNYAANISGFQLTTIQPVGVSYFPISARLSLSGVAMQIVDIVNGVSSDGISALANQTLRFKGTVYAEGVNIPLDFQYKVL